MLRYINVALMTDENDNLDKSVVDVLLRSTSNNIVAAIDSEFNNIAKDDIVIMTNTTANTIVINDSDNSLEYEFYGFESELKFIGKGLYKSIANLLNKNIEVHIDCFDYDVENKIGELDSIFIDVDGVIETDTYNTEYESTDIVNVQNYLSSILSIHGLDIAVCNKFKEYLNKLNKSSENASDNKCDAAVIPDTPKTDMMRKMIDLSEKVDSLVERLNKVAAQLNIDLDE